MRPTLAPQREAEILNALEHCIREHGIAGLTVQKVAEKSGYSRGHVRHYLGNKADQLRALINVYSERYASTLERQMQSIELRDRRQFVLDEMFGETWLESRPEDDVVLDHLNAYASSNPDSGLSLAPMYERILVVIQDALSPVLNLESASERARVILALAYGVSSMMRLGLIGAGDVREYARSLFEVDSPDHRAAPLTLEE